MELKWPEDFLSIANTLSFSRSAETRNVTQSAFSRRIRSLELWLGTELLDRSTYPVSLTADGLTEPSDLVEADEGAPEERTKASWMSARCSYRMVRRRKRLIQASMCLTTNRWWPRLSLLSTVRRAMRLFGHSANLRPEIEEVAFSLYCRTICNSTLCVPLLSWLLTTVGLSTLVKRIGAVMEDQSFRMAVALAIGLQ